MSTLTVRNLDPDTKSALKELSERHGRSMEAEARRILSDAVRPGADSAFGLGSRIRSRFQNEPWEVDLRREDLPRAAVVDE